MYRRYLSDGAECSLLFSFQNLASFSSWLLSNLMLQRQAFARGGVSYAGMELAALSGR